MIIGNVKEKNTVKKPLRLRLLFSISVLALLLASGIISSAGVSILQVSGVMKAVEDQTYISMMISVLLSVAVGGVLTFVWVKIVLNPICTLIEAINKVAEGKYDTKVDLTGMVRPLFSTEIGTLEDSFNHMTKELSSTELFHKDFISSFSHEFKTPIISICGFAEQIYKGELSPKQQKEFAHIIMEEASQLASLSNHILLLNKLENTNIISGRTNFCLAEQVRKCVLLFEEQWSEKNLELELELEEFQYYQNQEMLNIIWTNLISNGVKYTPANGSIKITCKKDKDKVVFSIKDSGIGMSEEIQQHIFDKFYQQDTSHAGSGNGLGLAIVKEVVTIIHASIEVRSELGKGTQFIVTLPVEEE